MIVYRLQDREGYGPWCGPTIPPQFSEFVEHCDCPFFTLFIPMNYNKSRFGCVSMYQIRAIFGKPETVSILKRMGLSLVKYDVPNSRIVADETQCVFDLNYAVWVGEYDVDCILGDKDV